MAKAQVEKVFPSTTPNGSQSPTAEETTSPPPETDADEWGDLERLRISQDFPALVGGQKVLTAVTVRRPTRNEFIRVRRDTEWQFSTALYNDGDNREMYLVAPTLWETLQGDINQFLLLTAINRQGALFLWPARVPGEDRRASTWHESALAAASLAMSSWVRVRANTDTGMYEAFRAVSYDVEPDWPTDTTFKEVMRMAFKGRYIDALDHPVLKRLRGEF